MRSWGWQVSLLVLARDCFILTTLIEFFYLLLSSSKSSLQSKHRYAWKWIKQKVGACFKWGLLKERCPLEILNRLPWLAEKPVSSLLLHMGCTQTKAPQMLWSESCAGCWPWSSCVQQELQWGAGACPGELLPCTSWGLMQQFWGTRGAGVPPPLLLLLQISARVIHCHGTAEGGVWGSQHTEI